MDDSVSNGEGREDSIDASLEHNGLGREDSANVLPEHNGVGGEDSVDAPPEHNGVSSEDSTNAPSEPNDVGSEDSADAPLEPNGVGGEDFVDAMEHNGVSSEDSADALMEHDDVGSEDSSDAPPEHNGMDSEDSIDASMEHIGVSSEDFADAPIEHNGVSSEDSADAHMEHNGVGSEDSADAPPQHNGIDSEDSTYAPLEHNVVDSEDFIDNLPEYNGIGREDSVDTPEHNGVHREDSTDASQEQATKKRRTRGATIMHEITRDSSEGQRRVIEYNEDGQPIGVNATKLKSFIGTCVRHHVPIIYDNWKIVPSEIKEKIYNLIKGGFVVDPRSKKNILQNAGTAFRQFKHVLTTKYVMPFKDNLVSLKFPPILYSHIEQEHWNTFVNSRLNEEFERLSQKNQELRGKNIYNHRLSRKGYANLAEELKKSSSYNENLNGRCILWKSARMNSEGMIVDEQTQEVVTRIDKMLTTQARNDVKSTTEDVLSLALGTPDHSGRVRGVGKFITPTQYFHTPKPSSRSKAKAQAHKVVVEKDFEPEVLSACTALLGLENGLVSSKKSRVRSTSEDQEI